MRSIQFDREATGLAAVPRVVSRPGLAGLVGAALAFGGCSGEVPESATDPQIPPALTTQESELEEDKDEAGASDALDKLPFVEGASTGQVLAEPLGRRTALGETTALHMRLPPPQDPRLADSLVRVVGRPDSLQVLFRADALAQLGIIPRSPGSDFFTTFASLSTEELARIQRNEDEIRSGVFGEPTTDTIVFDGRSAVARTTRAAIDPGLLQIGLPPTAISGCPTTVTSTTAAWGRSLFITHPAIVADPARTWDPCTGNGTQGGVWTFAHLIREMATGSGHTPEDFAAAWLSQWLNNYVVNGDVVPARTQMFNQVILPWATASGVSASITVDPFTLRNNLVLGGPLDLNIAPFSLRAIVNRIDLGKTSSGGGYNPGGGLPSTPGELRFIFGVVQPNPWGGGTEATCGRKPFTAIFEYGVPGNTCQQVVAWAQKWSTLQSFPGFTTAYKNLLTTMTQSVVTHGAAPTKGNKNAINQIRTNEAALAAGACGGAAGPWEMREFTLTNENPATGADPAATGLLRKHSVAQTPDDGTYSAGGPDPIINAFTAAQVSPVSATPANCTTFANYTVPYSYPVAGTPFRGGNSLMAPMVWKATLNPPTPRNICSRHQFSLNTCNGCHRGETATNGLGGNTNFTHIDPLAAAPVPLSKFLTGGGPGLTFNVNDPQYGSSVVWKYADLHRRLQRLFDLSHCTSCVTIIHHRPQLLDAIRANGPVPADIAPGEVQPFPVGPITSLDGVSRLLQLRTQFGAEGQSMQADFARPSDAFSH